MSRTAFVLHSLRAGGQFRTRKSGLMLSSRSPSCLRRAMIRPTKDSAALGVEKAQVHFPDAVVFCQEQNSPVERARPIPSDSAQLRRFLSLSSSTCGGSSLSRSCSVGSSRLSRASRVLASSARAALPSASGKEKPAFERSSHVLHTA
jgi:hypothetical protein